MQKYNPNNIEKKWQKIWREQQPFRAVGNGEKPKYYPLIEFPYPSGSGLHVGHPRPYTAMDVVARKRRLEQYDVLFSMGWDAFGLPAENYAIKMKEHPSKITESNIAHFKQQLQRLGYSFDWSREINTTDSDYYRWTQWIFIQLFKKGLAYKKEMMINWCPSCKIGLANEEVVGGQCERCHGKVVQRPKSQWMLKITEYADRLIDDLDSVNFTDRVKAQQRYWIGRSHGVEITFQTSVSYPLVVFTTRPDTIYGATYMVISPDHPMIEQQKDSISNYEALQSYRKEANEKSEFERSELNKDKTGVEIKGVHAIHPVTKQPIPIWISDYVLMTYGTGAIMAVPAHDLRDHEFAVKFHLPVIPVVASNQSLEGDDAVFDGAEGVMIHSPLIDGLSVADAKEKMTEYLTSIGAGRAKTNYKLRDWVFSRQRYWGEPIPLIHCSSCGWVPVPEDQLPLTLPMVDNYEPADNGESPLSNIDDWVHTTCPVCGGAAHRETDTMPQWAGSSWYYLRYCDPNNQNVLADRKKTEYWMNVDWYNGGMEHTNLHLLYSRFWHKFLYDIGVVSTSEPYNKRTSHGMILAEDGTKMSKSAGKSVSPDDIIDDVGADALRTFIMFIGDFEKSVPWNPDGVKGTKRFLERVWSLQEMVDLTIEGYSTALESMIHKTIKKVSEDYESLKFNTAIAQLMTLVNEVKQQGVLSASDYKTLLILLNPVAPHITEEIWENMGYPEMIIHQEWPSYKESLTQDAVIEMPIQVNGKLRATVMLPIDATVEQAKEIALQEPKIQQEMQAGECRKVIYVPGKVFNFVIK